MAEAKKKPKGLLIARRGFMAPNGRVVKGGQLVAVDDPVVKGRADLFDPADEIVEAATANPGELRINKKRESNKPEAHQSQKARDRAAAEAEKED